MKITEEKYKIRDLVEGFVDNDEEGCRALNGKLDIRPKYQREFIYKEPEQKAVIDSILKKFPISVMYWLKRGSGTDDDPERYEILDGQQRTMSICLFYQKRFAIDQPDGKGRFNRRQFQNLSAEEQETFLNYKLRVYICEDGTEAEERDWFQVINTAGKKLTAQELRNAQYSGEWLNYVKKYFKLHGPAQSISGGYLNVQWDRQEGLEKALLWVSGGDIVGYMSAHQHDEVDENEPPELYIKFEQIIDWAKRVFPPKYSRKQMAQVDWGYLYRKYAKKFSGQDADRLEKQVASLMENEEVTKKPGIYGYVLGEPDSVLHIRTFKTPQKEEAYERQHHRCPVCHGRGEDKQYQLKDMEGDHIVAWSNGGSTVAENCAMLCSMHNNWKSDKTVSEKLLRQWLDELAEMD